MTMKRVLWLDLVRVFAIVTIVFSHVFSHYVHITTEQIVKLFASSASLFFMCSGALIFPVRPSASGFYRRRFSSYVPLFVLFSVFYALMQWRYGAYEYDLAKAFTYILFVPTWSTGWFLYALTGLYLIAPVLSPWVVSASKRQMEYFLLGWLFSGLIPFVTEQTYLNQLFTVVGPFYGFVGYMVAGYYLTKWPIRERGRGEQTLFWAAMMFIAFVAGPRVFVTANRWGYASAMVYDLSVNIMAMNVFWFALFSLFAPKSDAATDNEQLSEPTPPAGFLNRVVSVVSRCTLHIYLVHIALIDYVFLPLGWSLWPTYIAVLASSLLFGILYRLARRQPL